MPDQMLTRRALYELVWSKPMTKAADELGLSDVGLKKVCTRHRVPTPTRGYWAKKDAGKPVKQTRLHDTADPQDERIVIRGLRENLPEPVRAVLEQERVRRKAKPAPQIADREPAPVAEIHPSVAGVVRSLRSAKIKDGVANPTGSLACGLTISASAIERVVAMLDGLARDLEERGLVLEPAENCMWVSLPPDHLSFSLTERIETTKHIPTLEELAAEARLREKRERAIQRGHWDIGCQRAYPEFDHSRTGELTIQIADQYVRGLLRRTWRDSKRQRLEALVPAIGGGIVLYLAGAKARREEQEQWQRKFKQEQEQRALAKARATREEHRLEFLTNYQNTAAEIMKLEAAAARLRSQLVADPPGELARLFNWTEARLRNLQARLTPERLAAALREKNLFPEVDDLPPPATG